MPSQFGQDLYVIELLGGLRGAFFLDSGAADGIRSSNTHLLETAFGWNGICVEPNNQLFAALRRNRRCHCVNCCLYTFDADVAFVERAHMLGGILHEYHPRHLQFARTTFDLPVDEDGNPPTVSKPARTIRSVLRECNAPRIIDYWSLDTEGSELAILKSFPFDEYSFRVLTVEHNRLPIRDDIQRLLVQHDFDRVATFDIDDCYVRRGEVAGVRRQSAAWTLLGRGKRLRL